MSVVARAALPLLLLTSLGCATQPSRREVTVDFLSVRGVEGNTTPALLGIEDNPADRIRVGVLEGSALQLSGQWRASVWLAAFQASLALDRPLSDWVIWVEAIRNGERFDGPSAGGLLTAGMLAGMTGRRADPTFTMTGTINPDGTIGPVGGIPQKFEAAIASGKRRLGYPLGQHLAEDLKTGEEVPLSRYAKDGVEVVEIPDIETAYEQLTGIALPQALPVSAEALTIPSKIEQSLREQTLQWLENGKSTWDDYLKLELVDPALDQRWAAVDLRFGETRERLDRDEVAAAYHRAGQMFIEADAAYLEGRCLKLLRDQRWEDGSAFVKGVIDNVDDRIAATSERMNRELARSTSDLMSLTTANESLGVAVRHFFTALELRRTNDARVLELITGLRQRTLKPSAEVLGELRTLLAEPLEEVAAANVHNFVADQHLGFRPEVSPRAKEVPRRFIQRLGDLYKIGSDANISYFEQTILNPIAQSHEVPLDVVKARFDDPVYQLIKDELRMTTDAVFKNILGDGQTLDLVRLAGALSAYVDASLLIAKYLSLEAVTGPRGIITALPREPVLLRMLELAETKARIHAARARTVTGEIPVAAEVAYHIGRAFQRAPEAAVRLEALQQFWRASTLAQMAVLLRR
jgi:hypothetical protein